jgi:hypothetical protein
MGAGEAGQVKVVIMMMGFTIIMLLIAWVLSMVIQYFSADNREARSSKKVNTSALVSKTRQLGIAKSALIKIAANDSGNPILDATIALEDIHSAELLELEN